jgi:hypothetical protein
MTQPTYLTHPSPLTPDQAGALVRLLAKATKAGFLPSFVDISCLLDLLDGGLPQRGAEPQVEVGAGGVR